MLIKPKLKKFWGLAPVFGKPAAVAGYTGPGDVAGYGGAYAYWGLRGYTAAYSTGGNPAVGLVDQSGANPITINILANGHLDTASIAAWVTAHSVTTIQIATLYDQSGHSPARDLNTAAGGALPQLKLNFFNTNLPAIYFDGGASIGGIASAAVATAQAQPLTVSMMARFNTFAFPGQVFTDGTFGFQAASTIAAADVSQYFGTGRIDYTGVADNSWASLQSVANGASSSMSVNGTVTVAGSTPGSAGIGSTNKLTIGAGTDAGASVLNGYVFEVIVIPNAVSTTNQGLQTVNQRSYGGF